MEDRHLHQLFHKGYKLLKTYLGLPVYRAWHLVGQKECDMETYMFFQSFKTCDNYQATLSTQGEMESHQKVAATGSIQPLWKDFNVHLDPVSPDS